MLWNGQRIIIKEYVRRKNKMDWLKIKRIMERERLKGGKKQMETKSRYEILTTLISVFSVQRYRQKRARRCPDHCSRGNIHWVIRGKVLFQYCHLPTHSGIIGNQPIKVDATGERGGIIFNEMRSRRHLTQLDDINRPAEDIEHVQSDV